MGEAPRTGLVAEVVREAEIETVFESLLQKTVPNLGSVQQSTATWSDPDTAGQTKGSTSEVSDYGVCASGLAALAPFGSAVRPSARFRYVRDCFEGISRLDSFAQKVTAGKGGPMFMF